jgi:hypothetical protein
MIHISSYIVITTSVGWFFEWGTDTHWLSTWVYAHLLIDLIFFKEPALVLLWLWFSKFSKNWFLLCYRGSQKLWKSQRTGQRLVMKTLNPKTGQQPFHENLHFFEVFEIIRTDKFFASNFFSQRNETNNYLILGHSNHENQWFFKKIKNPTNTPSYLSNVRQKVGGLWPRVTW